MAKDWKKIDLSSCLSSKIIQEIDVMAEKLNASTRRKVRFDDHFIKSGFIEYVHNTASLLADNIEDWRNICKEKKEVFWLCSGIRMFRTDEIKPILKLRNLDMLANILRDDLTSYIFISYVMKLNRYILPVKNSRVQLTFTQYLKATILQTVGGFIYKYLRIYYTYDKQYSMTESFELIPPDTIPLLSTEKFSETVGITLRGTYMLLVDNPALKTYLLKHHYLSIKNRRHVTNSADKNN